MTIDPATGALGTPIELTGVTNLHIEEMRFFAGTLYATSRDGNLVAIDPHTGAVTVREAILRASAMEVFE